MIKAIIFDFAGVIGADGYWIWLRENVKDIDSVKEKFHKISEKVDKGEISEKEFIAFVAEYTERPVEDIWPQIREKILLNHELIAIIKQLRKNYKTALLSNFVFEWLNEILTDHKLYDLFDEVIISSKHGVIKPDPAIFHKMLSMLQLTKDEVIFIDDRDYQVAGAKAVGIKAFLYTSNEQLLKDLESCGVNV